jgi:very-short-patch-repair endonuclease
MIMSRPYYKYYKDITLKARKLRKNSTPSEKVLWEVLRKKRCGYRFLRQHPVFYGIDQGWRDFYIPDFYCRELSLIIEVDGLIHETKKEPDKEREEKLKSKGLHILRFKNEDLYNIEIVIAQIDKKINEIK